MITSTEKYINEHEEEIIIKFLKRRELLKTVDLSFYEEKISFNFSNYVNNYYIVLLDINTLYRIIEKVNMNNDKELKTSSMKNFLMKVLDKHGRLGSILLKFADISAFDDETLSLLLTKYSNQLEKFFLVKNITEFL